MLSYRELIAVAAGIMLVISAGIAWKFGAAAGLIFGLFWVCVNALAAFGLGAAYRRHPKDPARGPTLHEVSQGLARTREGWWSLAVAAVLLAWGEVSFWDWPLVAYVILAVVIGLFATIAVTTEHNDRPPRGPEGLP